MSEDEIEYTEEHEIYLRVNELLKPFLDIEKVSFKSLDHLKYEDGERLAKKFSEYVASIVTPEEFKEMILDHSLFENVIREANDHSKLY